MNRSAWLVASILCAIFASGPDARAEGFVDLRGGYTFTEDGDVTFSASGFGSATFESEFDEAATGGLRLGYWLGFFPWLGVAADASYFEPDVPSGGPDIYVIPVSPLLLGRVPIVKSEEYPYGRVQPFVGVGPGIFVSNFDDVGYSDGEVSVGLDVHAGLKVLVAPWFGLFAQYRYTSFEAEYTDEFFGGPFPIDLDTEIEYDTHHAAGGIAFHF